MFNLGRELSIYLNPTEEDFVPDAVIANDSAADFCTFSLGSKVEQPTFPLAVRLAEDLQRSQRNTWTFFWFGLVGDSPF